MWRTLFVVIVLVQLGLTLAAKPSPVNREAIRYTLRLPAVDKIELQKLKPEGRTFEAVEATKVIEGDEARAVASLWRKQDYRSIAAICHYPAFGIKFYAKGELIAHASLCWDCDNIVFLTPKLKAKQGFTGDSKRGKELLDVFSQAFPQ